MQKYKILATLLAFVLVFSMLTVVSTAAGSITITASDEAVIEGTDSVSVTFEVSDNPGVALLGFDIGYDSDYFSISGVEVHDEVFGTSQITEGNLDANPYYFLANSSTTNVSGDGKLITVTFYIDASCPIGTYEITMNNAGVRFPPEAYDKNVNPVNMVFENGSITIEEPPTISVTGVVISDSTLSLEEGESETLTATVSPDDATDKTVSWSSTDSSVATVTDDGLVTAVSEGTATIKVTTNDGGFTAQCVVTVTEPTGVPGDINGDGKFTYTDITRLYACFRKIAEPDENADTDINGDGKFTYTDVTRLYAIFRKIASFE